jgi:sugar phosphate isomerase/epimerase
MHSFGDRHFPLLKRSYKHRYPFRLSVPSFVYPAGYADNARLLAPFVDEIELLLFESHPGSLPDSSEIRRLEIVGRQFQTTYHAHLPLDVDVHDPGGSGKEAGFRKLVEVVERVRPLSPTRFVLHVNFAQKEPDPEELRAWQERATLGIAALLESAALESRRLAVETLDYPPQWFAPIVQRLNLGVCVDVGHIVRNNMELEKILHLFEGRIEMVHLHGVTGERDHQALDCLAPFARTKIGSWLQNYRGAVCLEVFSFDALEASLKEFDRMMMPE